MMPSRPVTLERPYACVTSCCELAGIIADRCSVLEERLDQLEQCSHRHLIIGAAPDRSNSNSILEQHKER